MLPDPKDKLGVYELMPEASELAQRTSSPRRSTRCGGRSLKDDPEIVEPTSRLATG